MTYRGRFSSTWPEDDRQDGTHHDPHTNAIKDQNTHRSAEQHAGGHSPDQVGTESRFAIPPLLFLEDDIVIRH